MTKFTIEIVEFTPLARNTLLGFATVSIKELGLSIKDVTVHRQGERRWVGLPGKPRLNGDQAVKDEVTGRVAYTPILTWARKEIADAFSARVLEALDRHLMRQPVRDFLVS